MRARFAHVRKATAVYQANATGFVQASPAWGDPAVSATLHPILFLPTKPGARGGPAHVWGIFSAAKSACPSRTVYNNFSFSCKPANSRDRWRDRGREWEMCHAARELIFRLAIDNKVTPPGARSTGFATIRSLDMRETAVCAYSRARVRECESVCVGECLLCLLSCDWLTGFSSSVLALLRQPQLRGTPSTVNEEGEQGAVTREIFENQHPAGASEGSGAATIVRGNINVSLHHDCIR